MQEHDRLFMQRALELARLGLGYVSPNPMVGCVVVHQGCIIGEGWHRQYGGAHAEVNAIESVADKSLLSQSTVYVSLEPCNHWGKTPPCTDLLLQHKPKRVVICNADTNPKAAGGLQRLAAAGIKVEAGLLEKEGRWLNRRFFAVVEQNRPYIIFKWAQTADGYMARSDYSSKWISNAYARQLVHKWRGEEDAIMVGRNTARYDNPQLTNRDWPGYPRQPLRVVIDRQLLLPQSLHLFDGSHPSICYNLKEDREAHNLIFKKIPSVDFWQHLLQDLKGRGVQSVLIEGGPQLFAQLSELGLWDEIRVFIAPHSFGSGLAAPRLQGHLLKTESIHDNQLQWWVQKPF
ncbi:bifunctional diaminohydroxyphosphoribosylaminopyrimidine deaminase/5-amino-6-(5-phosphoribosylamino)uracil reductase RibD [Cesiribacter sp. SM1]|uniref:bifunctional diaminohydroxyphosphoribosylaminopyrimidine deaminase/5-amino-6-(5-phosphoribosylamino)uracil reductase RibD n=1 Tax=Cesiribacter sp. SM1 TaxID=2861196 RepID=UPI001CD6B5B7|nr:bifunctional diaminohydroxyphosphoribosylaminopyrimidine deaminase/5-amino-6-(5-phosphoribosylamino)uracil reductase RibD [Cesiribacter sp. SM1]